MKFEKNQTHFSMEIQSGSICQMNNNAADRRYSTKSVENPLTESRKKLLQSAEESESYETAYDGNDH